MVFEKVTKEIFTNAGHTGTKNCVMSIISNRIVKLLLLIHCLTVNSASTHAILLAAKMILRGKKACA